MKKPQRIPNLHGWILIVRDESDPETGARKGPWYTGWREVFSSQKDARKFATDNNWGKPWRVIRAKVVALQRV